jgi:rhodanese-related sulfurtransferase
MKRAMLLALLAVLLFCSPGVYGQEINLETYISSFDYKERINMKTNSKQVVEWIKQGKAQLVDIRFKEEYEAWRMGFAVNIPINELPGRLNELKKDKIIVTACPHLDRAIIAMTYLKTKGFNVKYLADGLVGMAEHLRGDRAREFIE